MIQEKSPAMTDAYISRFRSPEHAQKFLSAYETVLGLWPVPYETMQVESRFGTTHINVAGAVESPPLVLIHGGQISSPIWYPNIEPLSRHFRVYAPDVVDQIGRSTPTRQLKTPQDCVDWLVDLLDQLKLDRVPMVGHSHGGWQVLNMAIRNPQRLTRMALLSPAMSFTPFPLSMFAHMMPVLVRPTRDMFYWSFQWLTTNQLDKNQPNPIVELFMTGALSFHPKELSLGVVNKFHDADLRRVETPTLLLIGEHETTYTLKPAKVIERARRLIPHLEAALIPHGRHLFPVDQADETNVRLLAFLTG